ncbi:proteasome subunit alpha1, putative [Perkinsus marinus ATCC 50983]|uniref:Proteasome subunit alpha type n=1 Tax=Perkinsus marinus (strain ATCC 50983 / TXsc) TaxID=423536 RepID=C5L8W3_PERM5|nr:proteasome subunit alpha1, putative [Perkinsus marinus ATCC 50983]EER06821.1 proteasome subunit alpha1, putative [Perkinsus marinus ATCC 50983]|eukprot:XP_002775005.1 proteasome subunit alpha1, putative [Perkinsus marinus ATCC 50983]
MSRQSGYDRHITIFSPEGRLYQVEYAFKAVKTSGLTCLAMKGKNTVVAVGQKKIPDKLQDGSFTNSIYRITSNLGVVIAGMPADARALVNRARQTASEYEDKNGCEIPCHYLAKKIANLAQVYTQHAYMRPYGVIALFFGIDDEFGPQLLKVDPAGHYVGCKAAAAGTKEQEATNALEKIVRKRMDTGVPEGSDETETVEEAIAALQTVLSMDFKPSDIEVCVMSTQNTRFRKLTPSEIDEHLNAIAEKD